MSEIDRLALAKRILSAFKHFECFVFERSEYGAVRKLLEEAGLTKYVYVGYADPKYREIYVALPWTIEFEQECQSRIQRLLADRRVDEDSYKRNKTLMIAQCIKHFERERVKEIVNILERYINQHGGRA